MTKKDYELIADAIATVEADYKGLYGGILEDITEAIGDRLRGDNSRFDYDRFFAAAMPLLSKVREAEAWAKRVDSDALAAMLSATQPGTPNYEAARAEFNRR